VLSVACTHSFDVDPPTGLALATHRASGSCNESPERTRRARDAPGVGGHRARGAGVALESPGAKAIGVRTRNVGRR
jgi:hypothetical protein